MSVRVPRWVGVVLVTLASSVAAYAQAPALFAGRPIVAVRVEQERTLVTDPTLLGLIETTVGEPLSMADVRESIAHLDGLDKYDDVEVRATAKDEGVALVYVLVPRHPVTRVILRGTLGLAESSLRAAMVERFGTAPPASRAADIVEVYNALYRDAGYLRPRISTALEEHHDPDRADLVFVIEAGPRAPVAAIRIEGVPDADRAALLSRLDLKPGRPFDMVALRQQLERYERDLRSNGYYEARADASAEFASTGEATVTVAVDRGPHVRVMFEGDALPAAVQSQLVPIREEGSVDEDLLENASLAIQDYWRVRGFRDALADHERHESDGELLVTFKTSKGARYVVETVEISGHTAITTLEATDVMGIKSGEPFVQAALDASVQTLQRLYRQRGFTRATIDAREVPVPPARNETSDERRLRVSVRIEEGPRTVVSSVIFSGNAVIDESHLRPILTTLPGRGFADAQLAADRDRIVTEYVNLGYDSVVVEPRTQFAENGTRAHVSFVVTEGSQAIVDHIIVLGNRRTATETILQAVTLRSGQPLGYAALVESQQRLNALGLFRRSTISQRRHGTRPQRDVIVEVDEAPPVTFGYGGGVEGGRRVRPTAQSGQAQERFEIAPRAFFEIGRRNLWGKNRSVNLFTRVSLRARDIVLSDQGIRLQRPTDSRYGFNEYRVVGTYREPKALGTAADLLVIGTLDQSIRSSFNFRTRELNGRATWPLPRPFSLIGSYTYRSVELFDERFEDSEKPLIDRLFPQVNLSMIAVTLLRDTRTDVLDPEHGTFLAFENTLAARTFGSEVGFTKSYLEGKWFHRLPGSRRVVAGLAARIGVAHGFPVVVDGREVRAQLPASERFFAGGDTTVRGFSLDRLGDESTITPSGFPTGGNGLVVLNGELRTALFGALQGVVFVDAGNVFPTAGALSMVDLRPAAGFGVRYRSPVGPVRVDWGFNLNRRELVPGTFERGNVFHISLGQAF